MEKKTFSKTFAILAIFNKFQTETIVKKEEIMDELLINDLTFKRYIKEIRVYLAKTNSPYRIKYNRKRDEYVLRMK